ncbi:hypothetical protein AVO42_07075 [Thiomicrospira sp. XS5]|nr:hypothetical protein AVO42_07075 [Thiomicrospira sp. XS5]
MEISAKYVITNLVSEMGKSDMENKGMPRLDAGEHKKGPYSVAFVNATDTELKKAIGKREEIKATSNKP